jgi:hypothetical protein
MAFKSFQPWTLVAVTVVAMAGSAELLYHANDALAVNDNSAQTVLLSGRAIAQAPDYLPSRLALRATEAEPLPAQF